MFAITISVVYGGAPSVTAFIIFLQIFVFRELVDHFTPFQHPSPFHLHCSRTSPDFSLRRSHWITVCPQSTALCQPRFSLHFNQASPLI
jgi:hypothetical protein